VTPRLKTLKVAEPAKRSAGIKVPDVATLVPSCAPKPKSSNQGTSWSHSSLQNTTTLA
jgi:hypothetical protein